MADKFVMSTRQSAELDHAFERNGWSSEDVKWLSTGSNLASFLEVRRGMAKVTPTSLLEFVGTTVVAVTKSSFFASNLVVDTKKTASVKISYLGDNFKNWFGLLREEPFGGSILRYAKLGRRSVDGPIIAELGGEENAETTLTEVSALMYAQPNGENGALLTNGYANIFYVRDVNNVLRAVYVSWLVGGWRVVADEIAGPGEGYGGRQVFSRGSRLPSAA